MSRSLASRRTMLTALAGAAAIPLAVAPASAAPLANRITPRAQLMLELARQHWAAVKFELSLDDDHPQHSAAVASSEAVYSELEALADDIHENPVRSFADIIERAAVGFAQADRAVGGGLDFDGLDPGEHANLKLLAGVLELAGIAPESIASEVVS